MFLNYSLLHVPIDADTPTFSYLPHTMTLRSLAPSLIALCIFGQLACANDTVLEPAAAHVSSPATASSSSGRSGWKTMDEHYAEIADSVPGFGGIFYDSVGRLTVYSTTPSAFNAVARQRVAGLVRARHGGRPMPGDNSLQVLRGSYNYRDLLTTYRQSVLPLIPLIAGVTTSDIDETRNRIVVGVRDHTFLAGARQQLSMRGLPSNVIDVVVMPPAQLSASLTDQLRPVPGGAYIEINSTNACTMGYNLIRHVGGAGDTAATTRYFVINSHCSSQRNAPDLSQVRQVGGYIGREIGDPAAFTNSYTSACPAGYQCRWADASLFEYDSPTLSDHGRIAFPSTLGSLVFTGYMTITSVQMPMAGYTVNMIGSASGRRSGLVTSTCTDVWSITGWTNGRLLCQGGANYVAVKGDSGSPVITAFGDWTAWATGLHWGVNAKSGTAWFSSMDAVLSEFYDRLPGNPYLSPVTYP